MKLALRAYQWLAEAFPHEFKLVYGMEVRQLGEDVVEEIAKEQGVRGLIWLVLDIAIRVLLEYLSEMRGDLRYALRALWKSPGFALVGIISLGLGMGLTTSVFDRSWTQIFRNLPAVNNPDELVMPEHPVSYYDIEQYRGQASLFAGVTGFQTGVPFNISLGDDGRAKPERVFGQLVSPDYFAVFGVKPQRGRVFSTMLDKPGVAPAVVITDRFWRNRLNSSSDAIGQTLRINGQTATIVGIAPTGFKGALPQLPTELFVPITAPAALAPELADNVLRRHEANVFQAVIRLKPGVSIASAEAGLDSITRQLDAQDAGKPIRAQEEQRVRLMAGGSAAPMPRAAKPVVVGFLVMLLGLILALACMNLSNMLLARGAARRKELAIRLAVGASRFRLIRQMITEGILLALLGGVAGLGFAHAFSLIDDRIKPPMAVPLDLDYSFDWRAPLFVFALALVCGVGFSVMPAVQATKAGVAPSLKEGAEVPLRGFRRLGTRNLLVLGQVAGSLMLLLMTGFFVVGFNQTNKLRTNFDPNSMILLSVDPVRDGYSPEKSQTLCERVSARLKELGSVRNVALAAQPPFLSAGRTAQVSATNGASDSSKTLKLIGKEAVGAGYFAALSEPILAGREFEERDQQVETSEDISQNAVMPVLLNESAAHGFFPKGNPIGQRITEGSRSFEVVGLVADLGKGLIDGGLPAAVMYLPLTRRDFASPPAGGIKIMVRANPGANALLAVRREIDSLDPNLAVFEVRSLAEYLSSLRSFVLLAMYSYGGMGVFGLLLAAIGLAGVTAYAVARRRKEIGIRMALGARKVQVLGLVLSEGAALVVAGTLFGLLGACLMVKLLSALTSIFSDAFHFSTSDPRLLIGAPLLLAIIAMLACYIPARRSIRIDPIEALRDE